MIEKQAARKIASEYANRSYSVESDELVILDQLTLEKEYGWVFFYNSRRYLETDEFEFMLAGNGPLVVEKSGLAVHELGTASDVEESLRDFESQRNGSKTG